MKANTDFVDENKVAHKAGDSWMIPGPREFIPQIEMILLEKRKAIPLD